MIRHVKLKLRPNPSYPLCYHSRYQADSGYPLDENYHLGGNHETSMENLPTVHPISGWTTTMGPCLPIHTAMEQQLDTVGGSSNNETRSNFGGES